MISFCVLCFFYISTGWLAPSVSWAPTRTEKLFFRLLSLVFGWRNKSWKRDVNQQTCHVILMKDKLKTRYTKLEDSAENDEQSVEEESAAWDWHRTIENFFFSTFCATIEAGKTPKTSHETHNTQHSEAVSATTKSSGKFTSLKSRQSWYISFPCKKRVGERIK